MTDEFRPFRLYTHDRIGSVDDGWTTTSEFVPVEEGYGRPGWDDYFLGIAQAVAARGECVRSKVGAVLVRDNRIVATGYNGVAAGEPSCLDGICPRASLTERHVPYDEDGPGRCVAIHAEDNAIADALRRRLVVSGCTLYVTREPCERCAVLAIMFGLPVVWPGGRSESAKRRVIEGISDRFGMEERYE